MQAISTIPTSVTQALLTAELTIFAHRRKMVSLVYPC